MIKKVIRKCLSFFLSMCGILTIYFYFEKRKFNNKYIRLLYYHDIKPNEERKFEKQIRILKKRFVFISFTTLRDILDGKHDWNNKKPYLLLTFDDGRIGNYKPLLSILKRHSINALFFLCPDLIGTEGFMKKNQIKECLASGLVDIGCHTSTHKKMVDELDSKTLKYEILDSKLKLEDMFKTPIDSFSFPFGEIDSYSSNSFYWIMKSKYKYGFCTYSEPIVNKDTRLLYLPRTNIQIGWTKAEMLYQLNPIHDKKFKTKYITIISNYNTAMERIKNEP